MKSYKKFGYLLIGLCFVINSFIYCDKSVDYLSQFKLDTGVEVWLTVSSLAGFDRNLNKEFERQLELNWRGADTNTTGLWIGLFNEEPKEDELRKRGKGYAIRWKSIERESTGSHRTSVQFPYKRYSKKNLHTICLKYWIGLLDTNNTIIADNCLKTNAFWMERALPSIGGMSLMELMIPGTHNSASYDKFNHKENTIYNKYSLCQDETVFNQLVYGIRFLDLRVAYDRQDGNKHKLWIVHGPIIMKQTLDSVLAQVKRFLELAPKEVVVLDFHRFESGFNKDEDSPQLIKRHHRKVMSLIVKHLGDYLLPKEMGIKTTLNEMIAKNKRVVIGHPSDHFLVQNRAKHLWPNTDDIDEMLEFFNETICEYFDNQLTSAMAQLTPNRFRVIIDSYNGLRTMAQSVNRLITDAFNTANKGWAKCANVVSTDYFLGNNIIEISIKTNLIRAKQRPTIPGN